MDQTDWTRTIKMADYKRYHSFLEWRPDLNLRIHEAKSISRATVVTIERVNDYFEELMKTFNKH